MKAYAFLFVSALFIASCGSTGNKAKQAVEPAILKGYFVKNTVEDTGNLQYYVFKDQSALSQICGTGATMFSKPDVPDFDKQIVVAVAGKSTDRPTTIRIVEAVVDKGALTVSVAEEVSDEELSYTMRPLTIASFAKAGIKKVVFRKGGQDILSVDL